LGAAKEQHTHRLRQVSGRAKERQEKVMRRHSHSKHASKTENMRAMATKEAFPIEAMAKREKRDEPLAKRDAPPAKEDTRGWAGVFFGHKTKPRE
jgi:hypothetical protein